MRCDVPPPRVQHGLRPLRLRLQHEAQRGRWRPQLRLLARMVLQKERAIASRTQLCVRCTSAQCVSVVGATGLCAFVVGAGLARVVACYHGADTFCVVRLCDQGLPLPCQTGGLQEAGLKMRLTQYDSYLSDIVIHAVPQTNKPLFPFIAFAVNLASNTQNELPIKD